MPFKPLLELKVEHPFFASGQCAAASIAPDVAAAARMRGLRLLPRASPGRLALLADFTDAGETRVAIPEATLRFDLFLEPWLLASTDLGGVPPGTVFAAAGGSKPMKPTQPQARSAETLGKPAGKVARALSGRPRPGTKAADFGVAGPAGASVTAFDERSGTVSLDGPQGPVTIDYPIAGPALPGIAAIEVPVSAAAAAKAWAGNPPMFRVALQAAAAPWCYHLVTDLPNPLAEWRIEHPASDGPAAAFAASGRAEIAAPDPSDPYGSELLGRSAPLRVLRFVSDAAVPCSEARARRIALFAGDRQLLPALPNPSPAAVRLLKGKPAFGETLRFVTA